MVIGAINATTIRWGDRAFVGAKLNIEKDSLLLGFMPRESGNVLVANGGVIEIPHGNHFEHEATFASCNLIWNYMGRQVIPSLVVGIPDVEVWALALPVGSQEVTFDLCNLTRVTPGGYGEKSSLRRVAWRLARATQQLHQAVYWQHIAPIGLQREAA